MKETLGENEVVVHHIKTADNARLTLTRIESANGPGKRGPILFAHGTFSNRTIWLNGRGRGMAAYLAAAGYDGWTLEVREHGESRRRGMEPRETSFDTWVNFDVPAAIDYVYQQTQRPLFWVGHSIGGVLIYAYLSRYPKAEEKLRGIVSFASQAHHAGSSLKGRAMIYFTMAISRLLGYFPARRLRLGPEDEFRGVLAQWAGWNLRRRWLSLDGYDYFSGLRRIQTPVLALVGGGDHLLAPESGCRALFEALGSRDKQIIKFSQANGHAEDYDHLSIVIGKSAPMEIWPAVESWLAERE